MQTCCIKATQSSGEDMALCTCHFTNAFEITDHRPLACHRMTYFQEAKFLLSSWPFFPGKLPTFLLQKVEAMTYSDAHDILVVYGTQEKLSSNNFL